MASGSPTLPCAPAEISGILQEIFNGNEQLREFFAQMMEQLECVGHEIASLQAAKTDAVDSAAEGLPADLASKSDLEALQAAILEQQRTMSDKWMHWGKQLQHVRRTLDRLAQQSGRGGS